MKRVHIDIGVLGGSLDFHLQALNHLYPIDVASGRVVQNGLLGQPVQVQVGEYAPGLPVRGLVGHTELGSLGCAYLAPLLIYLEAGTGFVMPEVIDRDHGMVLDFEGAVADLAGLAGVQVEAVVKFLHRYPLVVDIVQSYLGGVGATFQNYPDYIVVTLI